MRVNGMKISRESFNKIHSTKIQVILEANIGKSNSENFEGLGEKFTIPMYLIIQKNYVC